MRVWEHKLELGQIDAATFKAETEFLLKGLYSAIGDPTVMKYTDSRLDTLQSMRRNVFTFVAFKNHQRVSEMVDLLEVNGKLRTKQDFIRQAQVANEKYNKNWLAAEYDTVVASGQTAAQWIDFEANKDLLPFLIYKTQADSRVRDSHSVLHEVCKPIDDPFWDEFYPPNGWRCRCYVLQVAKQEGKPDPESYPSTEEVNPIFRHNPGKAKVIFDSKHDYFASVGEGKPVKEKKRLTKKIMGQMRQILVKEDIFDVMDQNPQTGAVVRAHITHDRNELNENVTRAKVLSKYGYSSDLQPYDDGVSGDPQPDNKIQDGRILEFKSSVGNSSISHRLDQAISQGADIVSIKLPRFTSIAESKIREVQDKITVWIEIDEKVYKLNADGMVELEVQK